jgi:hypothetical protein
MNTKQLLEAAYNKLKPSNAWCQQVYARDEFGDSVTFTTSATQWCALGAVKHVLAMQPGENRFALKRAAYEKLLKHVDSTHTITSWNDKPGRTQREVLELYEKAIADCD